MRNGSMKDVSVKLDELPSNLAENTGQEPRENEEAPAEDHGIDRQLGLQVTTLTTDKARELEIKERRGVLVTACARTARRPRRASGPTT
jgi:hypothetical protein